MKNKIYSLSLLLSLTATTLSAQINFNFVCVDSVWYDSIPNFINVRIFNGDVNQINYPSVQIIAPTGDTIGNPQNMVTFFAHLAGIYLTYTDTITQTGITDFSNYTFLMSEGFGDTTVAITWCGPVAVPELPENEIRIYPNPAHEILFILNPHHKNCSAEVYNILGEKVFEKKLSAEHFQTINVSALTNGIYFIRLKSERNIHVAKFVKE